ncbi:hypothetical protein, partial [Enterobacter hormaechei]|uniref:hypothetical protein n=1 Tax=Enterobacter hormaechei TaxID=158836 RepID=UPI001C3E9966
LIQTNTLLCIQDTHCWKLVRRINSFSIDYKGYCFFNLIESFLYCAGGEMQALQVDAIDIRLNSLIMIHLQHIWNQSS